jgi:hypothetical protein
MKRYKRPINNSDAKGTYEALSDASVFVCLGLGLAVNQLAQSPQDEALTPDSLL